jgi:acetoin utilization protein AcuB
MTCDPVMVRENQTIFEARSLMSAKKIRHLPVMDDGGQIVGILSDRDIKLALGLVGAHPQKMSVNDVCHKDVYTVSPEHSLEDVAREMAKHHYGCAVIIQNSKLVGIFTMVDVCFALVKILEEQKN